MADNGATSNENPLNTPSTSSQSTLATASSSTTIAKPTGTATGTPKGNPAFRALGLPNFRFKLPSRNWLIFLTITGSWTGALLYDRRAKRKAQNKWCTLVSHIAKEPLPTNTLPRRVTIYLAAPPGDGLRSAREHFVEYVKPVLVAAALDWDVVEGRREGDIRAGLADRIRRFRRTKGDVAEVPLEEDVKLALERIRTKIGVEEWDGVQGDIVIGRHTWKEYVRGLHEGWLGPMDAPKLPPEIPNDTQSKDTPTTINEAHPAPNSGLFNTPEAATLLVADLDASSTVPSSSESTSIEVKKEEEPPKPTKPLVPLPYNTPESYAGSSLPPSVPAELSPCAPIAFPHILGFLNTPIRMYRFLGRRHLADDVGRQTAAAVLTTRRPFHHSATAQGSLIDSDRASETYDGAPGNDAWEQQRILEHEELEWFKAAKKRTEGDGERIWLDDMVLDPRIAERMRRFEVTQSDEKRADRIGRGSAGFMATMRGDVSDVETQDQEQ